MRAQDDPGHADLCGRIFSAMIGIAGQKGENKPMTRRSGPDQAVKIQRDWEDQDGRVMIPMGLPPQ